MDNSMDGPDIAFVAPKNMACILYWIFISAGFIPGGGFGLITSIMTISVVDLSGAGPDTASSFALWFGANTTTSCWPLVRVIPLIGSPSHDQSRSIVRRMTMIHCNVKLDWCENVKLARSGPNTCIIELVHANTIRFPAGALRVVSLLRRPSE